MPLPGPHPRALGREAGERGGDRRPRARGVDDDRGADAVGHAGRPVAVVDGVAVRALRLQRLDALDGGADEDARAALHGVDGVGHAEPRPVDAPLVEAEAPGEVPRDARLQRAQLVDGEARVGLAALEGLVLIVGREERVHERVHEAPLARVLHGHEERDAEEQVRGDGLDVAGVAAGGLGDVRVVREVAGAAVDHPAGVAAGAEGEVVALEEDDLEAALGGVPGDAQAVDPAADDHHVHVDVGPARGLGPHRERGAVGGSGRVRHASGYTTRAARGTSGRPVGMVGERSRAFPRMTA